jgi:hypothetical protein
MQQLPIGIQTFRKIREENLLYIDKTKEIKELIESGDYFFISRPRRFGKSLLISTLAEVFRGNKDLFKGLYIYDKIDWNEYPVIMISFASITYRQTKEVFYSEIIEKLKQIAEGYGIKLSGTSIVLAFNQLIKELSKINKVVILIDEYDKPIIDFITDIEKAKENREVLREFYSIIKDNDQYIKFCLLTGVSKFSKVSVFSGLNNLKDITLNERFSTICGLTQEEVDKYFEDRMGWISEKLKLTKEELREKIKEWYNGYSWDGEKRVYNPFSILNFYEDGQFNNYWFSTGTPTFLIERAKIDKVNIEEIENKRVGIEIFESFDITNIDFISLLFQTGYLTITSLDVSRGICVLNYPNKEVRKSFLIHIASRYLNTEVTNVRPLYNDMLDMLRNGKIEEMIKIIKSMISKIPYQLHIPSEAYYHSMFYIIFDLMGIEMDMEVSTIKGRIDGVIEFNDKIYIIEFKYLSENKEVESVLNNAIKQIKTKEYYIPYTNKNKPIKYLAIGVNREVVEYKIEE